MRNRVTSALLALGLLAGAGCDGGPGSSSTPSGSSPAGEGGTRGKRDGEAAASPQELATARGIIDRAVDAQAGSTDRLQKLRNYISIGQGAITSARGPIESKREAIFGFPDSFRLNTETANEEGARKGSIVFQGYSAWQQTPEEPPTELPTPSGIEIRNVLHAYWLATLLPFKDGSVQFRPAPEATVNGKAMSGVRAIQRGRAEVSLYFDNQTGLLAKLSYNDIGVAAGVKELHFSDYRDFQGIKLPTREIELNDGKKVAEWTISDYQFPEKHDPALFKMPKK